VSPGVLSLAFQVLLAVFPNVLLRVGEGEGGDVQSYELGDVGLGCGLVVLGEGFGAVGHVFLLRDSDRFLV